MILKQLALIDHALMAFSAAWRLSEAGLEGGRRARLAYRRKVG